MENKYEIDAAERFWIGPKLRHRHLCYKNQKGWVESEWVAAEDGTTLDPGYSEFSIRIHDPHAKTLSYVNQTIAIIPKSRLRTIHALIGEYLNEIDKDCS